MDLERLLAGKLVFEDLRVLGLLLGQWNQISLERSARTKSSKFTFVNGLA